MSTTKKPYRRFTARGHKDGGMDALRDLTERERGNVSGDSREPAPPPRAPRARVPEPDMRSRERALERAGRSWWSFRGLGPGGIVLRGLVILAGLFVVWMFVGFLVVRGSVADSNGRISDAAKAKLASDGGMLGSPTNTLIVGGDAGGDGGRPRADTIMIMRTDPDSGRIKFLSIPRDMRIQLGPYGDEKIAHSLRYAGQAGVIGAVRRLTGIPINHVIFVRFTGFPKLVDSVGGVTVDNPTAITNCPYPGGRTVSFAKGRITLTGERALEFVRVRKCDDDFARARRQQLFLSGLKSELVSPWTAWKAPWKGAAAVDAISTDMGVGDLAKFGWLQWRLSQDPGDRYVLAGTPEYIGGTSYVIYDPTQGDEQIRRFLAS